MKKLIILVCLLLSASLLLAQPYYFRHYQVENGLSNNTAFCSVQDGNGFMWFGTKDGLNRFDGYSFKTYRHDTEKAGSLGNDLISALHHDHEQTLWVGTNNGVYQYNPKKKASPLLQQLKGCGLQIWQAICVEIYGFYLHLRYIYIKSVPGKYRFLAIMHGSMPHW
ncbi:ligand-binding sensor domain-containing protein [Pedobacter sp. P26]|uniref:ligand-binding sensor domain-containing protein n=1 Tax=Pedobacter sp. P26 TaxID=3423956 RepID=UPI003D6663D0